MESYVVAGTKSWNRDAFEKRLEPLPGNWFFVEDPSQLSLDQLKEYSPRYVFFLHWSWIVPSEIVKDYECVLFHMTDVPFGRGGSPLQNLIARGLTETVVSAMRMTDEVDAGPVYLKEAVSLEGSAEEIFVKVNEIAVGMIQRILAEDLTPVPQEGEVVMFRRRKPADSELTGLADLRQIYDAIRMVDAEGYPKAFIEVDGFRFEFSRAVFDEGSVVAEVVITEVGANG